MVFLIDFCTTIVFPPRATIIESKIIIWSAGAPVLLVCLPFTFIFTIHSAFFANLLSHFHSKLIIMRNIDPEEQIMERTFFNLWIFQLLAIITRSVMLGTLTMYPFKWVDQEYHTALSLVIILFTLLWVRCIIVYKLHPLIKFDPLYPARGDANKCLDLLRLETSKGPIRTSYLCTYGSCTAILRLRLSDLPIADHTAAAEREISDLAKTVAAQDFLGTSYFSHHRWISADDLVELSYASVHCTEGWGGLARWIAKWQLRDSLGNRTQNRAPSDTTPLLINQEK